MKPLAETLPLRLDGTGALPEQMDRFPRFRYMGSKFRLLPWLHEALGGLPFETASESKRGMTPTAPFLFCAS